MARYSFQETVDFFSQKVGSAPPKKDLELGEVELILDGIRVVISKRNGTLSMQTVLGLLLQPIREERLRDLFASNFLGINTGGCRLSYDETGVTLILSSRTTVTTTPQENWEWLHRLLSVAAEWRKALALWDEFVPLGEIAEEKTPKVKKRQ